MWDLEPRKILVVVSSADCWALLRLAAAEARTRGCGIHLLHVSELQHDDATTPGALVLHCWESQLRGTSILRDARATMEHVLVRDRLSITTELVHGPLLTTVVARSRRACLVVMQHGAAGSGRSDRFVAFAVAEGVAAQAHAPVISIPPVWHAGSAHRGVVSVGVDSVTTSSGVLRVARDQAARLGTRLRVVHAASSDDPAVMSDAVAVSAPAVAALIEQSRTSMLLVIGRGHPRVPVRPRLEPVALAVLRWSLAPVLVVDTGPGAARSEPPPRGQIR